MKILTVTLLATALMAAPASACPFGKTAMKEKGTHVASLEEKPEQAISTFDPKEVPLFEDRAESADQPTAEIEADSSVSD